MIDVSVSVEVASITISCGIGITDIIASATGQIGRFRSLRDSIIL